MRHAIDFCFSGSHAYVCHSGGMTWQRTQMSYRKRNTVKPKIIVAPNPKTWMFLVSSYNLPNPLKPCVKSRMKMVVGTAPTGDPPTTSEWSTMLLSTKVRLILEVWRYVFKTSRYIKGTCSSLDIQYTMEPTKSPATHAVVYICEIWQISSLFWEERHQIIQLHFIRGNIAFQTEQNIHGRAWMGKRVAFFFNICLDKISAVERNLSHL